MNLVILRGNIGQDIDIKTVGNDVKIATTTIATSDGFGEKKKTNWHNIVMFGKQAESFAKFCAKGQQVIITGEVEYQSWEREGQKQYKTVVKADKWEFCGKAEQKVDAKPAEHDNSTSNAHLPTDDSIPF